MQTLSSSPDDVIATAVLQRRMPRVRNPGSEPRALLELKRGLAASPSAVLQKLAEVALELCQAQSAGISLLEEDADGRRFFRWHAVAGKWSALRWATLPRELSPCGTVLDRREPLLMIDPERYYTPLANVPPRVAEALLVPFTVEGETVGTVWVVSHDAARQFDAEDLRVVASLTYFAAGAYERLKSFKPADIAALSRMQLASEPEPDSGSEGLRS